MIFGNILNESDDMSIDVNKIKKPSKISSVLRTLSSYGMRYSDDVYKNMVAIAADKKLLSKKDQFLFQNLYTNTMNNWRVKSDEEKSFRDKTLEQRRDMLRKLATNPEIEDIIDIMANECIVYDNDEIYICKPFLDNAVIQDLNEAFLSEFRTTVDTVFYKMYLLANWKHNAWNTFRRYLIDGILAYEIVYDNLENPHSIVGLVDLDPATLTRVIENGITYWIQYKDVMGQERKLLDAQIIYIKYEDSGCVDRQSYIERLIRPFNIYRIVEQAQIIWTVTQSSFKTIFTIPVAGMNKAKGMQTLNSAMNRYKEDISFNSETGEMKINGKMNLPFNKEYWMPESENGSPQIETLVDQGPSLANSEQLKYFEEKLYKMSKIPVSRFDRDSQSTWFGTDPSQVLRDEINFSRFVTRIRNTFVEILLKPMRIQISLLLPALKNDKRILDSIDLRFNSYNQFTELMEGEINLKRIEHISALKDAFVTIDNEGNEHSFFSNKFLIVKYLKMSDADLELNEKYKLQEQEAPEDEEEEEEDETEFPSSDSDEKETDEETGGEEDNEEEQELDSEMTGNIKPESDETTQK